MKQKQKLAIEECLVLASVMKTIRSNFQVNLEKKEKEWIKSLLEVGNYAEIYYFCKQNIKDPKKFNVVMAEAWKYLDAKGALFNETEADEERIQEVKNKSTAIINEMKAMEAKFQGNI